LDRLAARPTPVRAEKNGSCRSALASLTATACNPVAADPDTIQFGEFGLCFISTAQKK
jgi:hypothetical protein